MLTFPQLEKFPVIDVAFDVAVHNRAEGMGSWVFLSQGAVERCR